MLKVKEITLAEAREVLHANPAAIPGYPVRFYRLFGLAVGVEQLVDSATGAVMLFQQDRDGPPRWVGGFRHTTAAQLFDRPEPSPRPPSPRLWRYHDERERYRQIGKVSVRWLAPTNWPVPTDLLDKLTEIVD